MPARRRSPRRTKSRSKSPRRNRRSSGKARRAAVRRSPKRRNYKGVDGERPYGVVRMTGTPLPPRIPLRNGNGVQTDGQEVEPTTELKPQNVSEEELQTKETERLWNDLTRRNRIFPSEVKNYEGEVDAILSRNVGKEQLDAWMASAFNEAKYSNFEWTTQVSDPDAAANVEHHKKRENIMNMVQVKIKAKLHEEALSRIISSGGFE